MTGKFAELSKALNQCGLAAAKTAEILSKLPKSEGAVQLELSQAAEKLPGVKTLIPYPCDCRWLSKNPNELLSVVIHLNDEHGEQNVAYNLAKIQEAKDQGDECVAEIRRRMRPTSIWTREQIADFLDELHDSGVVNIEFIPW